MDISQTLSRFYDNYRACLYIDITPMLDDVWTGIPVVTANLAREFIAESSPHVFFFIGLHLVSMSHVRDALARNTGRFLQRDCEHRIAFEDTLRSLPKDEVSVGLFPTVKRPRRAFDVECSIIHDITTITVPQFHTPENIRYHSSTIVDDLLSNDVTFCISDSTLSDVEAYFGKGRFNLIRAYNGVSWPENFAIKARSEFDPFELEPYFLVLGTREPRKNIARVFELITIFPEVSRQYRFVIAGKMGWMSEDVEMSPEARQAIDSGRVVFTGFVEEYEKYKLLLGAQATIYPSYLEGFGLPIIESLSVGTPCIASMSSSMPEVGGDVCFYFDPFSVTDLFRVVRQVQTESPKHNPEFRERCKARAAEFTWNKTAATMLNAIEVKLLSRKASGKHGDS